MRCKPSKNINMLTPMPVRILKSVISFFDISPKERSIDLCNEAIETRASARDIFLSARQYARLSLLTFMRLIIPSVTFVKAYAAIAIINIS